MKLLDFMQVKGIGLETVASGSSSCIYHIYPIVSLDAEYAGICDKCDSFWSQTMKKSDGIL